MAMPENSKTFPESGVIYVATRWIHFLIEAYHSIASLREKVKNVHVTVITDISQARFILGSAADHIILVRSSELDSHPYAGWTRKVECLGLSPYLMTVFLDTDTRVLSDRFLSLFEVLEDVDVAMVEAGIDSSASAQLLAKRIFNAGVIAFKNCPLMKTVFSAWLSLQSSYLESILADSMDSYSDVSHIQDKKIKKWLLAMDQTSLVAFLSPDKNLYGVRLKILDPMWNFRRDYVPPGQEVIVHHADCYKVNMEATRRFVRQRFDSWKYEAPQSHAAGRRQADEGPSALSSDAAIKMAQDEN